MAVVKLSDYRPPLEAVERKVADIDDGFTRTANSLLEAVMLSGLTQHQLLIVMAVWRKTYGYNKKMDWIGNAQFEELTGMPATKCSTAKNELVRMKVLTQQGRQVGMNKEVSEWQTKFNGISKTFTESVKLTFTESVKCSLPNRSNTKDNNTKDNKDIKNPMSEQVRTEQKKPQKRKPESINFDDYLIAYNEEVGDRLPHAVEANADRQRKIKTLIPKLKTPNTEGFRAYVRAFVNQAKPFYFGENNSGWTADLDYLLRPKTLTGVREGKFAGRAEHG